MGNKRGLTLGFGVMGGLWLVGVCLQMGAFPLEGRWLSWPVNAYVACALLVAWVGSYTMRQRVGFIRWCMTYAAAIPALVGVGGMTLLLGSGLYLAWPFWISYAWMVWILGLVCVKHLHTFRWAKIPFLLNHVGLWLVLMGGALGQADVQRCVLRAPVGQVVNMAVKADGYRELLPFSLKVTHFQVDGYVSHGYVEQLHQVSIPFVIKVNHPFKVAGWDIYQMSYEDYEGTSKDVSLLELVRDPWLPVVYVGMGALLLGAFCELGKKTLKS